MVRNISLASAERSKITLKGLLNPIYLLNGTQSRYLTEPFECTRTQRHDVSRNPERETTIQRRVPGSDGIPIIRYDEGAYSPHKTGSGSARGVRLRSRKIATCNHGQSNRYGAGGGVGVGVARSAGVPASTAVPFNFTTTSCPAAIVIGPFVQAPFLILADDAPFF